MGLILCSVYCKNLVRRGLEASGGLAICALGTYLQLQANIGMAPWNALNQGLALNFPITYGVASVITSVFMVAVNLLLREKIGIGTILDCLLMGVLIDLLTMLNPIALQQQLFGQIGWLLAGMLLVCIGQYLYIRPGLCCGPRDAFLLAAGRLVSRVPIGAVNLVILTVVLALSLLLGSPIGMGTVIGTFGTGAMMQLVFHLLHFDPRRVTHESLLQNAAQLRQCREPENLL